MNKKIVIMISVLVVCIIGVGIFLFTTKNQKNEEKEIEPQEEMSDEQMRQTIVTLYYQNKETKQLMPEGRTIDSKTLLADPYVTLINLLIEGPKNEKLEATIPQGTRVLKAELKGDIVYLDLSKEFIDNHTGGEEKENKTIYSIVNTLTGLNEVNGVKILINGRENQAFKDNKINFKNAFMRIEKENVNNGESKNKETTNNAKSNTISNTTTNTNKNN